MKIKYLSLTAISTIVVGNITKEDIFFITSIIITILNLILEYLRSRKNGNVEKS